MHLAIGDFHHWTEAMNVLGLPDIGRQAHLIPDFGRHGQDLRPVFSAVAQTLPKMKRWDIFYKLANLRCVVGVMQDTADLLTDPQFAAREYLVAEVAGKSVARRAIPFAAPWKLRFTAPESRVENAAFDSMRGVLGEKSEKKTPGRGQGISSRAGEGILNSLGMSDEQTVHWLGCVY